MSISLKEFGYEEIRVIGRGQFGLVHLVKHIKEQHLYVCKTIDLTCQSKKERDTAQQEVALLRRLEHPNIVDYKESFFIGNAIVIAMQFCEGGDLASYIKDIAKKRASIKEAHIMSWFVQILCALDYVHGERILHRDLKSSNLFLAEKPMVVKLGDFGISRQFSDTVELATSVVGTPNYMSPEVCENKPYTFKSDVWSLGCVVYELCMLKHAFVADNLLGLVHRIVSGKYESIPPMYSANLNNLIQRMLTRNASNRPSIRMLLDDRHVKSFMGNRTDSHKNRAGMSTAASSSRPKAKGSSASKSDVVTRRGARQANQKPVRADGRPPAQAWPSGEGQVLPGEVKAADDLVSGEEYEDDFCSEDDSDSTWHDDSSSGLPEVGMMLSPVYEEDIPSMEPISASSLPCQEQNKPRQGSFPYSSATSGITSSVAAPKLPSNVVLPSGSVGGMQKQGKAASVQRAPSTALRPPSSSTTKACSSGTSSLGNATAANPKVSLSNSALRRPCTSSSPAAAWQSTRGTRVSGGGVSPK